MAEGDVTPEEFVTPGRDKARARVVHDALRQLATGGAGDVLQEMAREVLAGRTGLREALQVGAYADALMERFVQARAAWERLPEQEREAHAEQARRYLAGDGAPYGPPERGGGS
ncbi:hypothetical protein [Streptomyces sp. NPDC049555]|uniref:hypothetical protein n=1 Tax=Streptomyces sp. NPDC049555 TaxID=3154930 RepID=UPI003442A5D2